MSTAASGVVWQRVVTAQDAVDGVTVPVQLRSSVEAVSNVLADSGTSATSPVVVGGTATDPARTTTDTPAAVQVPEGGWLVWPWSDTSSTTTTWTPAAAGARRRPRRRQRLRDLLVADEGAARPSMSVPARTATTKAASAGTSVTLLLAPAG